MESQVYIVGPLELQNEALSSFLEKETGLTCTSCRDLDLTSILGQKNEPRPLILWDCLEIDPESLWTKLCVDTNPNFVQCFVALFNVSLDMGVEKDAAKKGVRGVFYKDAPLELFAKGVKSIIGGKLWFSRDTMSELALESRDTNRPAKKAQASLTLTPREKEILIMMAAGATNAEIADRLFISTRTVRSHLYNIYRKIEVPNRLQAALWAIRNF
jgi:DNA-binding NarL/FixJ family response regulator